MSCIRSVVATHLPSPKAVTTNEGESFLKQTNVTKKPNVDLKHRRLKFFWSELPVSNDVLIAFQQDDHEPQMDFMVVAPTKPMNENAGMKLLFLNHVVIFQCW